MEGYRNNPQQPAVDEQLAQASAEISAAQNMQATTVLEAQAAENQETAAAADRSSAGEFWTKHRGSVGLVGGGALLLGGIGYLSGAFGGSDKAEAGSAGAGVDKSSEICADPTIDSTQTENMNAYTKTAFLPKGSFDSASETKDQVLGDDGWFKKSPLGTTIDAHSLAALNAVFTVPSTDGKPAVTDGNLFINRYESTLNSIEEADSGEHFAEVTCENTFDEMRKEAQYNTEWAQKGDRVIHIVATRDKDGDAKSDIDCMTLVEEVAGDTLKGMELQPRKAGDDSFESILITEDGEMYVRGIAVPEEKETEQQATTQTGRQTTGVTGGHGRTNGGDTGGGGGDEGGGSGEGGGDNGDCDGDCEGGDDNDDGGGEGGGGGGGESDNDDGGEDDSDDGGDNDDGGGDEPEKSGDPSDEEDEAHDENID